MDELGNQTDEGVLDIVPPYFLKANQIYPRVAGVITFLSSVYMLVMAWKRREFLFHNLVLGMSINFIVYGAFLMYGTAAIPYDDKSLQGSYGFMGTTATCTMQGFFMYVCGYSAGFYYSSFSIYCYIVVINDFQQDKIVWVEKWIHLLVHIYPISIAIYLLVTNGFNNTNYGFCGNASYPLGCEFEPDTTCERGPQGPISRNVIDGLHAFLILFIPTVGTVGIFFTAKQQAHHFPAKIIGPQLCIYVVTIYYTALPFIILVFIPEKKLYPFVIFAVLNYSLCGFWFMHVYRHFFSWIGKLFRRIQQQQQQQSQQQLNDVGNSSSSSE